MDISVLPANFRSIFTCPICKKLLKNATSFKECCHSFCKKCITKKLTEKKLHKCPVCNVVLGCHPLRQLRQDYQFQELRGYIFRKRINKEKDDDVSINNNNNNNDNNVALKKPITTVQIEEEPSSRAASNNKELRPSSLSSLGAAAASQIKENVSARRKRGRPRNIHAPSRPSLLTVTNVPARLGDEKTADRRSKGKAIIVDVDDDDDNTNNNNGMDVEDENAKVSDMMGAISGRSNHVGQHPEPAASTAETDSVIGPTTTTTSIWFRLVPSHNQLDKEDVGRGFELVICDLQVYIFHQLCHIDGSGCNSGLPEIQSESYIRVKEVHRPVSFIKKYVAQKLNVYSEDEVEISMLGEAIGDNEEMTMEQLLEKWCEAMPNVETQVLVGSSANDFVMNLNYAYKP